ncbi:hypothetical protein OPT61_g8823 [Boeremia exigua]|uniref:Uncharacterized protein n=1 Tax=Boeremia exigua TaxID=749465 RepID=A0ACC2HXK5_9PLEO|nr:hypothetical protein OPT61_g8823 [Boeremia exigua]
MLHVAQVGADRPQLPGPSLNLVAGSRGRAGSVHGGGGRAVLEDGRKDVVRDVVSLDDAAGAPDVPDVGVVAPTPDHSDLLLVALQSIVACSATDRATF